MAMRSTTAITAPAARAVADDVSSLTHLEYRGVSRHFRADKKMFTAVSEIDLTIEHGEFVTVVGPSGCGKSTLLNMAAGLLRPTSGEVMYDGDPVDGINTKVGYVTQKNTLLQWRTVEGNVGLPLELQRVRRSERRERVREMLDIVGLAGFERRYPSELSGGMLKRALLAQTLIYEPTTLLMDEPFGALDAQMRAVLQDELLELWTRLGQTVVFVTHDLEEALLLADRVVVFGTNPGRIVHVESVPFERPRHLRSLRADPTFAETWERLWTLLSGQMEEVSDDSHR